MQGHIRKHGNGWQYIVYLGRDPLTGNKKQKCKTFERKDDAQRAMQKLILQIENEGYFEDKNITVEEYMKKWLDHVMHKVGPGTYAFYKDVTERVLIPGLGKAQLSKLSAINIQEFLDSKLKKKSDTDKVPSGTTVRHFYSILNIALNQAVTWRIIQNNPCNNVDPPRKNETNITVLNAEQVKALLEYTKTSEFKVMYMPLHLALFCGLRRGEILGLQWNDVDTLKGVIRIQNNIIKAGKEIISTSPKSENSIRTVELLPLTIEALKQLHKEQFANRDDFEEEYTENNFVCTWPDGRSLKPDYVTQTFKKLLHKCGLPDMRFHDLRHTHATLLLLLGVQPKVVSERLGHAKIDITLNTYSHVLPSMQKEAVIKLENLFENKPENSQIVTGLSEQKK